MARARILFFCGERSPWGRAHIEPLLADPSIEVAGFVVATDERWATFGRALSGPTPPQGLLRGLRTRLEAHTRQRTERARVEVLRRDMKARGVPFIECHDANSETALERFRALRPDLLFSAAYPQIFKKPLLSLASRGAVNSHPSLLPRCRGAHPVFWAIASGETTTGATIHEMTAALDEGPIMVQLSVPLHPTDAYGAVYDRLLSVVPALVDGLSRCLRDPDFTPVPQDHTRATYFRNDRTIHHRVFWAASSAKQVCDLVRACSGTAYCFAGKEQLHLLAAEPQDTSTALTNGLTVPPGTIVESTPLGLLVAAHGGFVLVKRLHRAPLLRWSKLQVGQILG